MVTAPKMPNSDQIEIATNKLLIGRQIRRKKINNVDEFGCSEEKSTKSSKSSRLYITLINQVDIITYHIL